MTLKLTNTLSGKLEEFSPLDSRRVTMYVCGPTVYNYSHIGNARPAVIFDVLYRVLREGFDAVLYARNYTDVDDKINAKASAEGVPIHEITNKYIEAYQEDMTALGVLTPDFEPRVTQNINSIELMVAKLIEREFAYVAEGHVLFDVEKFPDYGNLSGRNPEDMVAGARIEIAPYKRNPADFVLWKPSKDGEPGWKTSWSFGRPGWHIECSAMINDLFGKYVDIHGGGADLIFPHHENEIAQSTCYNRGESFCAYWIHNGHLTVEGQKMSKSIGNVILTKDLLKKYSGEVIRYALLAAHYRQPLDWSQDSVLTAKKSLSRLYRSLEMVNHVKLDSKFPKENRIKMALFNDLNTADALAALHGIAREIRSESSYAKLQALKSELLEGGVLLGLLQQETGMLKDSPKKMEGEKVLAEKIREREQARMRKDFKTSDRIRDDLASQGIFLEDRPDGTSWYREEK